MLSQTVNLKNCYSIIKPSLVANTLNFCISSFPLEEVSLLEGKSENLVRDLTLFKTVFAFFFTSSFSILFSSESSLLLLTARFRLLNNRLLVKI
jgi:hypothetical protein